MSAPYSVRLDPDVAQQLVDQGGALLVLGMPEGSYFGIDHMAFRCGPRFRGIKMLPPGPHFVCYSIPGSERRGGGMGPVTGFFFHIAAASGGPGGAVTGNVIIRRYDAAEELLVELPEEEAQRYALGVRRYEFDGGLAPYNLHAWRQWKELTSCLDAQVIDAVQPVGGNICTAAEAATDEQGDGTGGEAERPATAAEARLRQQLQEGRAARNASASAASPSGLISSAPPAPADALGEGEGPQGMEGMEVEAAGAGGSGGGGDAAAAAAAAAAGQPAADGGGGGGGASVLRADGGRAGGGVSGRCFYSALPRLVKEADLTPARLTAANLDRTTQLESAAGGRWGGEVGRLVGEMQFAFIAFVFGQSLQGFRQWRALVTLFLNCEEGPLGPRLAPTFTAFVAALRAQLALALSDASASSADLGKVQGQGAEGVAASLSLATHGSSLVEEVLLAGGGRDCFLRHHLGTFFEVLREAGSEGRVDPRLQQEADQLRAVLSLAVGWQFDGLEILGEDDDDEYAPVVVELHGEGEGEGVVGGV